MDFTYGGDALPGDDYNPSPTLTYDAENQGSLGDGKNSEKIMQVCKQCCGILKFSVARNPELEP